MKAMLAIGFSAEKLYGSAWLFYEEQSDGGIIFHQLDTHLPFYVVRQYGHRLYRTYGFHRDSFTVDTD